MITFISTIHEIRKQNLICSFPAQQFVEDISYILTLSWYCEIPCFFKLNLICFLRDLGQKAFSSYRTQEIPPCASFLGYVPF